MIHASRLRWLILTLITVFLDRLSKAAIEAKTVEGWRHELIHNFIYLVHSKNPGIAFSIFADSHSDWVRYGLIAGSLVVIAILAWYLVAAKGMSSRSAAGLALLLGAPRGISRTASFTVQSRIFLRYCSVRIDIQLLTWRTRRSPSERS